MTILCQCRTPRVSVPSPPHLVSIASDESGEGESTGEEPVERPIIVKTAPVSTTPEVGMQDRRLTVAYDVAVHWLDDRRYWAEAVRFVDRAELVFRVWDRVPPLAIAPVG